MPVTALSADVNLLGLHRLFSARFPVLLESALHGSESARFDILFCDPEFELSKPSVNSEAFLPRLDAAIESARVQSEASNWPFHGGWLVFLGYELASEIEPVLSLPSPNDGLPVARAVRFSKAIMRNHETGDVVLFAEQQVDEAFLDELIGQISQAACCPVATLPAWALDEALDTDYLEQFARAQDYIAAGDVFQVNLSRLWQGRFAQEVHAADLYAHLRTANPAPFAASVIFDEGAIISSSPERLLSVQGGVIETRPIAGTRPRGMNENEDSALSEELIGHIKERAEHVMLLDLERNDLGRVAQPGSVEVNELMSVERYAHVHHIVSNVRARLRDGVTVGESIAAVFPGGTITGCPKVRCMEILAELEQEARGAYTGSLGYINHDGSMDLNILIRSFVLQGSEFRFRTGGGVVFDSIGEQELAETRHKAKGLLKALGDDTH